MWIKILIAYLIVSVFIGICKICIDASIARDLSDVPIGDLEYYDTSSLGIHPILFVFFPSIIVYYVWVGIVAVINFIIDLF